jgi:hypothetical protein
MDEQDDRKAIVDELRAHFRSRRRASVHPLGAVVLLMDIKTHLTVPAGGGRPTNLRWTLRRSIHLTAETLQRLQEIASTLRRTGGVSVEPMQLGALLLERVTGLLDPAEIERDLR